VVRNAAGRPVTNAPVGIKVSILQGTIDGSLVYSETHTIMSNTNGLVTFVIGQGTVLGGVFANIDWTNGPYFIKTEMDPSGDANYSITGASQMLSVPYALHSATAETLSVPITESDPIFMGSDASSITSGDILDWNTAFFWGNHASEGYVVGSSRTLTINGVGQDLSADRTWNVGTVTAVGLALPSIFTISGTPVTGSGTLTASLVSQPANRVFASPVGGSGVPAFRELLAADIPDLDWSKITTGKPTTVGGYGITDAITTESDPVFVASAASSIAAGDILDWNTAFSWGNHASAGYVLSSRNITINGTTQNLSANRTWNVGTVTSVGLALPSIFSTSGSPVTGSGTLTASLVSQPANRVFASPGGGSGTPSFRSLLAADIPDLDWSKITSGKPTTVGGYGITDAITTESDPVFVASAASSIAAGDILDWNTAFLWGDHASEGYVLSSRNITINGTTQNLSVNRTWNVGTVTSVGLELPSIFAISESPVTGSGTLTASLVSQPANRVFASPVGGSGVPAFRELLEADIPGLDWVKITSGKPTTVDGYGITDAVTTSGDQTIAGTKTFSSAIVAENGLNAGGSLITNLADPQNNQDAVTKSYFDNNRVQDGENAGEMLYWNGSNWITIPPGSNGQSLVFCNGVPSWGGCAPEVTTLEITNNTGTTASSGGNVILDGGQPVTQRGVCWSTAPNPTIDVNEGITNNGSGTGAFTSNIIGLMEQTTYYVRAYAINDKGVAYGNQVEFTTPVWMCGTSALVDMDGNVYSTVLIGAQCWMAENLNVGVQIFTGSPQSNNGVIEKFCYNNQLINCDIYGGLYSWNEAMNYTAIEGFQGICPDGWRIPKDSEWVALLGFVGVNSSCKLRIIGDDYWTNNECATDEFGFAARGAGRTNSYTSFLSLKSGAFFWTSTEGSTFDRAFQYSFFNFSQEVSQFNQLKTDGLSIRCIKSN
jgi:uncharacterized protein (TIGR02145 family)